MTSDPLSIQESHSPTVWESVKITGERRANVRRRRRDDARLWGDMDEELLNAACEIETAFRTITGEIAIKPSPIFRVRGAALLENSEWRATMQERYFNWGRECAVRGISHADVISIICFGKTLREIDACYRQRKGKARDNLERGLELYCDMKGRK